MLGVHYLPLDTEERVVAWTVPSARWEAVNAMEARDVSFSVVPGTAAAAANATQEMGARKKGLAICSLPTGKGSVLCPDTSWGWRTGNEHIMRNSQDTDLHSIDTV